MTENYTNVVSQLPPIISFNQNMGGPSGTTNQRLRLLLKLEKDYDMETANGQKRFSRSRNTNN
jgi:hypothetical protein